MDLQARKLELIQLLSLTTNESLIARIESLIKAEDTDFWDEIPQELKDSIERGLAQADAGKTKPHSEVQKMYSKWL